MDHSIKAPDRTTAEVFPQYIGGQIVADSATLKWWVVIRDGFVVLSVKLGHDTNVATSLVVDGIAEHSQRFD